MEEDEAADLAVKTSTSPQQPHKQQNQQQLNVLQRQCSNQLNESSGYTSGFEDATGSMSEDVLYRAMYDYQAHHDDELTLSKGCEIRVLSKRTSDEGWWLGVCVSDGRRGIFPSNYVEAVVVNNVANKTAADDCVNGKNMPPQIPYTSLEFRDCIGAGGFGKVFRGLWRRPEIDDGYVSLQSFSSLYSYQSLLMVIFG